MSRINRRDFISKVSKHTDIRADVVEELLQGIVDVAIEEIVNNGEFGIKDLFSISAFDWAGYNLSGRQIAPQKRLKVRLSEKVKTLWKLRNSDGSYSNGNITKDNWREVFNYSLKGNSKAGNKDYDEDDANLLDFLNEDEI